MISIYRVNQILDFDTARYFTAPEEIRKLSEEEKKVGQKSHQASFGPPSPCPLVRIASLVMKDSAGHPYVCFTFNYLSRELLELRNLLPAELPPESSPFNSATKRKVNEKSALKAKEEEEEDDDEQSAEEKALRVRLSEI